MAETTNIKIIESEAEGYFKGERREQIENAAEKVVELLKKENLSIKQASKAISIVSRKIDKMGKILLASTTVE